MNRALSTAAMVLVGPAALVAAPACSRDEPQAVLAHDHGPEADEHVEQLDLILATAGAGVIDVTAAFPGEVILNPDRMAHIVPRAAGVVREVRCSLGQYVEAGQVLAWIESDELAEAKLAFYATHAELGCCQIELPRAQQIFQNTNALLALLETGPTPDRLRELDGLEMGEYRGRLLTAYEEYRAARKAFERERTLFDKNITSESEFIAAESAARKAEAAYAAARDIARYQVLTAYSEAARQRQVAEFEAVATEQRLRLKGVDDGVLSQLLALVPTAGSLEPCRCDDPNCQEGKVPSVMQALSGQTRLGWYPLRAPLAGFIAEKHLALGEQVDGQQSVMTVADVSSVWVRFNVYQKDLGQVKIGQTVTVDFGAGVPPATGTVSYVSPVVDKETRTARARVELDNEGGAYRPGLYATVTVGVEGIESVVVVPAEAVQVLEGEDVVFVEEHGGFHPVPVRLGRADRRQVAILTGLEPGQRYVAQGAFGLKARIVTERIDPHAGHGH
jgi:cobalt-zinc-cadmium efflux system membrane fusion protein